MKVGAHERFTPDELVEDFDAQQASYASDGQTNESCWEVSRWIAVEWRSMMATIGVDWW